HPDRPGGALRLPRPHEGEAVRRAGGPGERHPHAAGSHWAGPGGHRGGEVMNPFVADPHWGWWIVFYFYLGGLAAGAYFLATLIELFGRPEDRALSRMGYRIAFPLVSLCGILLTVDLERPERFWHMLLQSEVVEQALEQGWPRGGWGTMLYAPMLKVWSPMSIGAWALF